MLFFGDTFLYSLEDNECDSETTKFSLMGERERNKIEEKFKKLTEIIRDQKDLIDKRQCAYKEVVTRLKGQLEEGNKVRKKYKEKEDQCQRLKDEVTSLRNELNEKDTTIKKLIEKSSYYKNFEDEIFCLKEDLENSNKQNEELPQADEEQENDILKLKQQVEEGIKYEEIMKKKYLEKEEKYLVEVNILKGKLEEKDKLLRFQDINKVLDSILSSQRYPIIKCGLGLHETIEGESSSQDEARNSNAKSEMLNKEIRGQPHQQPRKETLKRKSFTSNYGSDNQLFPMINNVECFICHNFGHVRARWRSRMVQANNRHIERSSASRYFKGFCFSCNMFGHKDIDSFRRNMKHIRCYACNKFGHIEKECRRNFRPTYQNEQTLLHSKVWKKKELQPKICGIAQYINITDSGGMEGMKFQCSNSHTQL